MDIKTVPFLRMESHSENNPRQRVKATPTPKGGGVDKLKIGGIITKINILFRRRGWMNFYEKLSIIISIASLVLSGIVAIWSVVKYVKSMEPQLSMKLRIIDAKYYLTVTNTGKKPATDVYIDVESIADNGDGLLEEMTAFVGNSFTLFAGEDIQAIIATDERTTLFDLPTIKVKVRYYIGDTNHKVEYTRYVSLARDL